MQQLTRKPVTAKIVRPASKRVVIFSSFFVALALFLIINLGLQLLVHSKTKTIEEQMQEENSGSVILSGSWPWWITKSYLAQGLPPDMVLLGSSQMATAVFTSDAQTQQKALDCVTHRNASTLEKDLSNKVGKSFSTFNWSMGGAMASDQDMVAHALLAGRLKPKLVIIGVSPRDFMDNTLPSASSTEPFRFFSQFIDLGKLTTSAFPDDISRFGFLINKYLPMCQLHAKVSPYLASDKPLETSNKQQFLKGISASGGSITPGQWVVPANIPYMFVDNTQEYMRRYADPNPPLYAPQLAFFNDFLDLMRTNNIKVLVVAMPSVGPNRKLLPDEFWSQWRANISGMSADNQADWLDLSESPDFAIDDYLDTVHLSAQGGAKFFDDIVKYISSSPHLRACLSSSGFVARLHHSR